MILKIEKILFEDEESVIAGSFFGLGQIYVSMLTRKFKNGDNWRFFNLFCEHLPIWANSFFTMLQNGKGDWNMAKHTDVRLRLLYLMTYLKEFTDSDHPATLDMIEKALLVHEFAVGRKGIDSDIDTIQRYDPNCVKKEKIKNRNYYYWNGRSFTLPEVKILIEGVESSKLLTESQSFDLIKKLESLTIHSERSSLQNQLHIIGRPKAANPEVFKNVTLLHSAIADNKKVRYHYTQWDIGKNLIKKKNGAWYIVSPIFLAQDQEKLYLVGYVSREKEVRHYRVDKIVDLEVLDERCDESANMNRLDIAKYTHRNFGMFNGKQTTVKLQFSKELTGVALDRFGQDINLRVYDDESIVFSAEVMTSEQFYGFIFALGDKVRILGPDWVIDEYKELLMDGYGAYYGPQETYDSSDSSI